MGRVVKERTEEPEIHQYEATGFTRLINATRFSWSGLCAAFKSEEAVRQEIILLLIGSPLAIWLGQNATQRSLLIGSLFLILIVELLNTAVETTIDRISHEIHELSGKAKDIGSAAVLITIILAAIIWGLILSERFL